MENLIHIIEQFVQGSVSAVKFVDRYLTLVRELRDEVDQFEAANPDVWSKIEELLEQKNSGRMESDEFEKACRDLVNQRGGLSVVPYSKADEMIWHLFVEADAYRPEAKGDEGWYIGEDILLREAKAALKLLSKFE